MILKKLKPGMTVYRVKNTTGLSTFNGKWQTWTMCIKEIDEEKEAVLASGYGGEHWYAKQEWSKWRLKNQMIKYGWV